MKLRITSIADAGVLERERIIMIADADENAGTYAVFRTWASDDDQEPLGGNVPTVYWFVNKDIKKGDFLVLYSKSGTDSQKPSKIGSTSYFFYWGRERPLWNDPDYRPVLVNTTDWSLGPKISKPTPAKG